jgi:hypothetical protein
MCRLAAIRRKRRQKMGRHARSGTKKKWNDYKKDMNEHGLEGQLVALITSNRSLEERSQRGK